MTSLHTDYGSIGRQGQVLFSLFSCHRAIQSIQGTREHHDWPAMDNINNASCVGVFYAHQLHLLKFLFHIHRHSSSRPRSGSCLLGAGDFPADTGSHEVIGSPAPLWASGVLALVSSKIQLELSSDQ